MKTVFGKGFGRKVFAFTLTIAILLGLRLVGARVTGAADSTSLGGLGNYAAAKTTCYDWQNPTVGGYHIGDSEHPMQNDIAPKSSATKWCEEQGYSFGFAKNMWWTGANPCMVYPNGPSGGNTWGLSHHCYAIATIRCCY